MTEENANGRKQCQLPRREFLSASVMGASAAVLAGCLHGGCGKPPRPNVILCMTDDQGWADAGYQGHPTLKTPTLDQMAAEGVRFTRFYSAAPVCSPTRGSCLTGRHPSRYGIDGANVGHMPPEEVTLAEALKPHGYTTGHFGKWHLGTLTTKIHDSNRGRPGDASHYSPPWDNGFDVCFSTEAKVPTWDPMTGPETGEEYGTYYWKGPGERASENLGGDDSRVIMDRVVPFVRDAAAAGTPFLAVIWFHTPHKPIVSGPPFTGMYGEYKEYFGCITAMDQQLGRLRSELERLGIARNTMLWFASDNGPENGTPGSTGPLRDRKRSLHEGGVRVPGLFVWPGGVGGVRTVDVPCSTSDYFPTVLDALRCSVPEQATRPYDGMSLMPFIRGEMGARPRPIAFQSRKQCSVVDYRFKIYSADEGKTFALYDLIEDPGETTDVAAEYPKVFAHLRSVYEEWRASCLASRKGADYPGG